MNTVSPAASGYRNSVLDGEVTQTSSSMGDKAEGTCGRIIACCLHNSDGDTRKGDTLELTEHRHTAIFTTTLVDRQGSL